MAKAAKFVVTTVTVITSGVPTIGDDQPVEKNVMRLDLYHAAQSLAIKTRLVVGPTIAGQVGIGIAQVNSGGGILRGPRVVVGRRGTPQQIDHGAAEGVADKHVGPGVKVVVTVRGTSLAERVGIDRLHVADVLGIISSISVHRKVGGEDCASALIWLVGRVRREIEQVAEHQHPSPDVLVQQSGEVLAKLWRAVPCQVQVAQGDGAQRRHADRGARCW